MLGGKLASGLQQSLHLKPVRNSCLEYFSQNVPESSSITTEETKIILKAYFTQKVGSVGNFECGNQVYSRRQMQTYEPWYIQVYIQLS